ncbi:SIMPL domain-containing protein [Sporocytophaga myxococcoides]|uniref:SIMPL domain-containing protein n=1 Tax=Sporocytophaga myxococcoides TaxID=153721 RepID=UPI0004228392|nr:SIMPL domain-containing protein [Sporocytophaga myxococcoides]
MKKFLTLFFLLTTLTVSGQILGQQPEKPTLNVTGSARVIVKPDLGVLNISVSEIKLKMSDAIKALGEKSYHYNDLLKKLGFNEKEIKTTSFSVSQNRVYRNNEYIDSGYVAFQNIRIEFTYSQQILQKIVGEFSKSEKPINFNFDFELSETLKQKVQTQIIDYAIKDGSEKAATMAKASKVKLVSISHISYGSWSSDEGMQLVERRHEYSASMAPEGVGESFNFTPDDLTFRDSVTITWNIE